MASQLQSIEPVTSSGPHFTAFCEAYLRHTKGRFAGKPVILEKWQRDFVNELFLLDENGKRVYTSALFGLPRKNGKTLLAASIALYLGSPADGENAPEVILAAGSRDQAGMVYSQAKAMIDHYPALQDIFNAQKTSITCSENGGVIKRVSADGKLQHGLDISACIKDELHAWLTPRQVELDEALETASGAREEPLILGISTSGWNKDSVLGKLYDKALKLPPDQIERSPGLTIARDRENGFLFWWYGVADDGDIEDEELWMQANPASWITVDFLRRQKGKPQLSEGSFRRFHLNQWTKAESAWLPTGTWQALQSDTEIPEGADIQISIDASITSDSTAISWAWKPEEGPTVVRSRVWSAVENVAHHVFIPGGRIDLRLVTEYIQDVLNEKYVITEITYDPRFFETLATDLDDMGFVVAPFMQNSAQMADALQGFYIACRTGLLTHDGDPILTAHVEATAAIETERGWKISKIKSTMRIDACVSTVMCYARAQAAAERSNYFF